MPSDSREQLGEVVQPLEGIKVLDLSNLLAGPMTGMHLADFGAEVIKVEQPNGGDELRRWGLSKDGVGLMYKLVNRNKKGITLNLRLPEGQALARRLAAKADVVIENFRPGTLEQWGLGYASLAAENRRLVMARITGYGQEGPYSRKRGFGTIGEALSGFAAVNGAADGPPVLPSFGLGDTSTSIYGAYAIMLGLFRAQRTGKGQYIDLALYDGLVSLLGSHIVDFDQLGIVHQRSGSRIPFVAPRNVYRTADGQWIALAGSTQRTFEAIAKALDLDWIVRDPRFSVNSSRLTNVDDLDDLISEKIGKLNISVVIELLEKEGAPVGPIFTVGDLLKDPHMVERQTTIQVEDSELGMITMQNVAVRLSETPGSVRWAGPAIGAHNDAVYGDELGIGVEELDRLRKDGVI